MPIQTQATSYRNIVFPVTPEDMSNEQYVRLLKDIVFEPCIDLPSDRVRREVEEIFGECELLLSEEDIHNSQLKIYTGEELEAIEEYIDSDYDFYC